MPVRNAAATIAASAQSILAQDIDLELVIVDDGSTDGTARVIDELVACEPRIRLVRQPSLGITEALRQGCASARAPLVARQDAGDLSLPPRLARQHELLAREPEVVLVSCSAQAVGPAAEPLFVVSRSSPPAEATRALRSGREGLPHHGTALFRRSAYERVGGYRTGFPVAQDWDLWLRLTELGLLAYVPETLYTFEVGLDSISARRRTEQQHFLRLALRCALARAADLDDMPIISRQASRAGTAASTRADSNAYLIGKCLLDKRDPRCRSYLRRAIRERWLHPRAWLALALARLVCRPSALSTR